jgi:hypothetical protein
LALRTTIALLQQLLNAPLSDAMKQKIQTKIDYLEIVYSKKKAPKKSPEFPLETLKTLSEIIKAFEEFCLE